MFALCLAILAVFGLLGATLHGVYIYIYIYIHTHIDRIDRFGLWLVDQSLHMYCVHAFFGGIIVGGGSISF